MSLNTVQYLINTAKMVPIIHTLHTIIHLIIYCFTQGTLSIQSLQKLSSNFNFTTSSSQIQRFFSEHSAIDFIEFCQFMRHQEITLKRLFIFIDNRHKYNDPLSIEEIQSDINEFKQSANLHYFWSIDSNWAKSIFSNLQKQKVYIYILALIHTFIQCNEQIITYLEFRKEVLLNSSPSTQNYYKLHLEIANHKKQQLEQQILGGVYHEIEWVPGVKNEDVRQMFDSLSCGKGAIDIKTLYLMVKESKIPVSEHQIMRFFINCDINENDQIDFYEFCHFMRSEEEAIRRLFDQLDLDENGYLTLDEIKRSFHIKYIKDHKDVLNEELKNDMNAIDDWLNSIYEMNNVNNDSINIKDKRINYEDFRQYAMLSGARSLLSMIQSTKSKQERFYTDFIHDFDDIYLLQRHDHDTNIPFDKEKEKKLNAITFVSGTIAGITSRTLTAPIDRVKLMMQLKSHGSIGSHVHNIMMERSDKWKIFSFWRGNLTNCIKMAPETAIKFTAHSMLLRFLRTNNKDQAYQYHFNFIAGAGAGCISQTMIYPLEIAKTRLALSQPGQYRNFIDCINKIVKFEGPRSLYNGWTASVTGIMPYCAIEMGVFFTIKDKWHQRYGINKEPDLITLFSFGGIASVSGTIFAYPFQLVRTKLQTQGMPGNKYRYKGLFDCFRTTWKRFGFFGLYSGIIPNFAKSIPATCISYVVVEKTKSWLKEMAHID